MRASDLLGLPVVRADGQVLGRVLDVRLEQDGPLIGAFSAMRVQGFVVGHHSLAARLGYDRHEAHGPWLVAAVVRRLSARTRFLAWDDALLADGVVVCSGELQPLPALA